MSNRPAGRRPRYVRAIADRFPPQSDGYVLDIECADGRRIDDWFPGSVQQAVGAARVAHPGCAIRGVMELSWADWVGTLDDWALGP